MKKLGSKLTTGDVVTHLPGNSKGPGVAVNLLIIREDARSPHERVMHVIDLGAARLTYDTRYFQHGSDYEVERRPGELEPSELAALIGAARTLVETHDSGDAALNLLDPACRAYLAELVDRLDPPAPPTLDEVLGALDIMVETPTLGNKTARDILNRARRAGLLPGGAS